MAIVTWEAIAGRRLFRGESDYDTLRKIVAEPAPPLSSVASWIGPGLDAILANALERDAERRTPSARVMADALEVAARRLDLVATTGEVADFLRAAMAKPLAVRRERLRRFLDAGGTTGAMEAAPSPDGPTARMPDRIAVPSEAPAPAPAAAPIVVGTVDSGSSAVPSEEEPIASRAVTSVGGSDVTDRALVAAGLRPRRRSTSSGVLAAAALVVVAGGASAAWILHGGGGTVAPVSSIAPPVPGGPGLTPSAAPIAEPSVAPIASATATPAASPSATASASAVPAATPPPLRTGRPGPPAPLAPSPPAAPTGPIRQNPYR
jgi:hypothetical protein